jgi:hypothetical protein
LLLNSRRDMNSRKLVYMILYVECQVATRASNDVFIDVINVIIKSKWSQDLGLKFPIERESLYLRISIAQYLL